MPKCPFCNKVLKTDRGFEKHMCEKKNRYVNFNEVAYNVWLMICNVFHMNIAKDEEKRKMVFINDASYKHIVEFTEWVLGVPVINLYEYLCFLNDRNIKINQWMDSRIYRIWILSYLDSEPQVSAIKRSQEYLDSLGISLEDMSPNKLYFAIIYGRISNKYLKDKQFNVRSVMDEVQFEDLKPFVMTIEERLNESLGKR